MGAQPSSPELESAEAPPPPPPPPAQVRERHLRALYICVPVEPAALQRILLPPARPHVHAGKAWVCAVVDDLFKLEVPLPGSSGSFVPVPGMNGWMMKLNALVECAVGAGTPPLPGYQILSLDFEGTLGPSAYFKKQGAISTQRVPTSLATFAMSAGPSGRTEAASLEAGTPISAVVASTAAESATGEPQPLVSLHGVLEPLDSAARSLCEFVVGHPHKFLAQEQQPPSAASGGVCGSRPVAAAAAQLAWASWREGYDCAAAGCMGVAVEELLLPVMSARLGELALEPGGDSPTGGTVLAADGIVCFLQPEYSMVDCKNRLVPSPIRETSDT